MTSKQFAIRFVCGGFLLLALVGLFNRVVDPFWYYRDIEIKGFNAVKTKFRRFERHVKPALLMREQPEAIILGSSFSEVGFDPTNHFFTKNGRLKSMNFAMAGASWDLVQCDFEFAVSHSHIKRALVGLHPGKLPIANCEKDFAGLGQIGIGELLFSDRALLASVQTIREQKDGKFSHTREGMYFYVRNAAGMDNRFKEILLQQIQANSQRLNTTNAADLCLYFVAGCDLDLSGLRRMINTAKQHGVELVLFAYPKHAYSLELSEPDAHWQALKQIANLVEVESAGRGVHVWHFYGYNDTTAEPIGTTAKYWQDPYHFNFEMGNLMLEDMLGGSLPKFGRQLVSGNIDADYQNYLQGRTEYLQRHPEFQVNLQKLLPTK